MKKQKIVSCKAWRPLKKSDEPCCNGEGVCLANVLRFPTIDFCNEKCMSNTSKPGFLYVAGFDYTKKTALIQKIFSYLKAELSLIILGQSNDRIFKQRMNTCRLCEHLVDSDDEVGHCGACGCGMSKRASLTIKGRMPLATCPKGKWNK